MLAAHADERARDRQVRLLGDAAAYGSRALIQKNETGPTYVQEPIRLIDLTTGQKLTTMPADTYLWPLLGTGS